MKDRINKIAGIIPLPSSLNADEGELKYRQGVAMTVLLLTINAILLSLVVAVFILKLLADMDLGTELLIVLCILAVAILQTIAFYAFANIRAASMLILIFYYLMTAAIVFFTGGYESPLYPVLVCTIAISFRFGHREDGYTNTLLVGFAALFFIGLHLLDIPPMRVLRGFSEPTIFFLGWISTIITITACLATYSYDRND